MRMIKRYRPPSYKNVGHRDVINSIRNIVNKCCNNFVWGQMVGRLIVVIISQYMQIPNHYIVHLKLA